MYVLHGSWLVADGSTPPAPFVSWAETSVGTHGRVATRRGRDGAMRHPFAATAHELKEVWRDLSPVVWNLVKHEARASAITVLLPTPRTRGAQSSALRRPEPSTPLLRGDAEPKPAGKLQLLPWRVETLTIPPYSLLSLLVNLPSEQETPPGIQIGSDLRFWCWAGKFVLELISRERFKPVLLKQANEYVARWQPLLDEPKEQERMTRLVHAMPPLCRALVQAGNHARSDAPESRVLLDDLLSVVLDAFARQHADFGRVLAPQTVAEQWLNALCTPDPVIRESSANLDAFYDQYRAWAEPVGAGDGDAFRICFRLDPPETKSGEEIVAPKPNSRDWRVRYLLQANDDPSLIIPAETVWRERGSTLKFLNRKLEAPQERLLAGLGMASRIFPPFEASLRTARPEECRLDVGQAFTFLRESSLLLQASGFGVLVPGVSSGLGVRVNLKPKTPSPQQKGGVAGLPFNSLVEYDWQLALGGAPLSRQEFDKLAALKVPLVQVRGQWIELHPEQIERAIRFWQKQGSASELSLQQALRIALSLEPSQAGLGLPITEVAAEGWIADLMQELERGDKIQPVHAPETFRGSLRSYQAAGLSWLAFLRQWGLGACLADDMGLGKTVEVAALLLHERAQQNGHHKPALVICPTSVVSNWQRELSRFAPDLRVLVHHGAARNKSALAEQAAQHDVVLSSYALLHRDAEQLAKTEWGDVILDEAQNIKNAGTKQAQAARQLAARAEWRAVLTGTPVENRLTEIWSLFQFLNPDYLGSERDFYARFAKPIERTNDAAATQRLKSLVSPFILRRVKTDPNVIGDLPHKNEMKVFCNLTKEQATLYEAVVRDSLRRIAESEGMARRGIVLATLMELKQVCNHPAQFLGDGSTLPGRSGKLARLTEMLEEVRSVQDRALIFTQFAEMGRLLRAYLQEVLGEEVLFLHGGTPAAARTKMIDRFQNDPHGPLVFILSLKAGGTGLNLMRANHVFHFDRWWNPAVENQATDRAFRIGQTKNVQVHKFLVAGTFEEKIDEMIERKKALAESIVSTSEAWITEMTTEQLRELFVLRREAISDR